ncbi:hypothetical protein [Chitinimonas arctica]|uniref:hypothetical protein n=1 Tax=Chitinimonas arctica TaxID=2594795 RepID=UPI0015D1A37A|nr:hypothetical protein [Chitinimonas arctica]
MYPISPYLSPITIRIPINANAHRWGENLLRLATDDPSLLVANFSELQLDNLHMEELVAALARNTRVCGIDLSNNQIGPGGARALARVLRQHRSVRALDLSGNPLGNIGIRLLIEQLGRYMDLGLDNTGGTYELHCAPLPISPATADHPGPRRIRTTRRPPGGEVRTSTVRERRRAYILLPRSTPYRESMAQFIVSRLRQLPPRSTSAADPAVEQLATTLAGITLPPNETPHIYWNMP